MSVGSDSSSSDSDSVSVSFVPFSETSSGIEPNSSVAVDSSASEVDSSADSSACLEISRSFSSLSIACSRLLTDALMNS